MRGTKKRISICVLFVMLFGFAFLTQKQDANAHTVTPVARVTIADSCGGVFQTNICYNEYNYGGYKGYGYTLEAIYPNLYIDAEQAEAKINVEILEPSLITADSISYDSVVTLTTEKMTEVQFSFLSHRGTPQTLKCHISTYHVQMAVDNIITSAGTKGFCPSKNNYLYIRSNLSSNLLGGYGSILHATVRILNNKNKWVYQKKYDSLSGRDYINLKWNGKASKKNEANVKATYVKNGTYTIQVSMTYDNGIYNNTVTKTKKIKVSKKAPSGTKGLAKAKGIVTYTGNANVDYMAEQMIKAAGVKSSMSDDKKVKKIYSYMTRKFKHKHYGEKTKTYYNLSKLENKITAFKTQTDKKQKQGKLMYNYMYPIFVETNMSTRSGSCTEHAIIFKILCNHVGVEASVYEGYYKNRNGSLSYHFWNSAIVNGKTYYYDVDIEIQNYGKGQGNYYWYKKTKAQAKKNHKFGK